MYCNFSVCLHRSVKLLLLAEHIVELDSKTTGTSNLYSNVMEETGRMGVDLFIDNARKYMINCNSSSRHAKLKRSDAPY